MIPPHFYCPELARTQKDIPLFDKEELHHLIHVLRAKPGDPVTIFSGKGLKALGVITAATNKEVRVALHSFSEDALPQPLLVLACAIPKRSKFEIIIEKCTELGVDEIIPLRTTRTLISHSQKAFEGKHKRFAEVALNACKQCQRAFLPKVHPITDFQNALSMLTPDDIGLIGSLGNDQKRLSDLSQEQLRTCRKVFCLIGPEGDFTSEELKLSLSKGFIPVTLGPNILKVDTAASSIISYLMLTLRS